MLIVLAGRLRRGERCRRRRDVQGASFGGSFVPCELRHPRQGCLSCEYRVDVVWSPFILSIDFFYVVYCSPYYFSLYNPRTPHLYFLCLPLSIYSITYTTFSIAQFYALVLLSLVFKQKKKKTHHIAERMPSVPKQSVASGLWTFKNSLLVFTAYIDLSIDHREDTHFNFLMIDLLTLDGRRLINVWQIVEVVTKLFGLTLSFLYVRWFLKIEQLR